VNEGIVKGCKDMGDAENEFAFSDLRTKLNSGFFLLNFGFFGWLQQGVQQHIKTWSDIQSSISQSTL
jgi:hypothetical protein